MTTPPLHASTDKHWTVALVGLTLLAAALRLYALGRHSLWYDESISIVGALQVDADLTFIRGGESHVVPLFAVLVRVWLWILEFIPGLTFGTAAADFWVRLPVCLAGIALIPLSYACAHYILRNPPVAFMTALLMAISPFQIYYAQELRPHSLYALLVLAALYCTLRALNEDRPRWWVLSALSTALALYTYYFALWYVVSIHLFVLLQIREYRKVYWKWIGSQAVAGLLVLPAVFMALLIYNVHESAEEHWFDHPTVVTLAISVKNYFAGYSPRPLVYWPLFVGTGTLALFGMVRLRHRRDALLLLAILAFLPLVIQLIVWNVRSFSFYTHRIQVAYMFPYCMLVAAGFAALRRPAWIGAAVAVTAGLTAPAIADVYAQRLHPIKHHVMGARYKVDSRSAARYIDARYREGDAIAHAATFTLSPFNIWYLDREQSVAGFTEEELRGFLRSYPDEKMWSRLGFLPQRIESIVSGAPRVWYVQSWWERDNPLPLLQELRVWLDAHAMRIDEAHFDGVSVYLYDLSVEPYRDVDVHRVADFGRNVLPLYTEAGQVLNPVALDRWTAQGGALQPPIDTAQGIAFAAGPVIDTIANNMLTLPAQTPLRISNPAPNALEAELGARWVGAVLPVVAFARNPEAELWRPTSAFHGRVCMTVRLREGDREGILRKRLRLQRARYAVFLRAKLPDAVSTRNALSIRLDRESPDGERYEIGTLHGSAAESAGEWQWYGFGDLVNEQDVVNLVLTATLSPGPEEGEAHLDRLLFIETEIGATALPNPDFRQDVTVEPGQTAEIAIPTARRDSHNRRLVVELNDGDGFMRVVDLDPPISGATAEAVE